MKIAVIFAALCVAYMAAEHRPCPLMREIAGAVKKCIETTNPDKETKDLVRHREGLDDEKANCFRACILNEAGLMENGAFNFPRMEELLNGCGRMKSDVGDELVEKLKSCQEDAEAFDNDCTVAGKYAECLNKFMPPHRRGHRGEEDE